MYRASGWDRNHWTIPFSRDAAAGAEQALIQQQK